MKAFEFFQVIIPETMSIDIRVPYVPGSVARVKLVGLQIGIATDATVGARNLYFTFGHQAWANGIGGTYHSAVGIDASQSGSYTGIVGAETDVQPNATAVGIRLPDIWLPNEATVAAGFLNAGGTDTANWTLTFCREVLA